jgi:hypothetical protein
MTREEFREIGWRRKHNSPREIWKRSNGKWCRVLQRPNR